MTVDPTSLGYDLFCTDDLDPLMSEVSEQACLSQDLGHRLETPRGGLIDDPNYGTDARADVSRDMSTPELLSLGAKYSAELAKDERVARVDLAAQQGTRDTVIDRFTVQTASGPFRFTADVSSAATLVKEST